MFADAAGGRVAVGCRPWIPSFRMVKDPAKGIRLPFGRSSRRFQQHDHPRSFATRMAESRTFASSKLAAYHLPCALSGFWAMVLSPQSNSKPPIARRQRGSPLRSGHRVPVSVHARRACDGYERPLLLRAAKPDIQLSIAVMETTQHRGRPPHRRGQVRQVLVPSLESGRLRTCQYQLYRNADRATLASHRSRWPIRPAESPVWSEASRMLRRTSSRDAPLHRRFARQAIEASAPPSIERRRRTSTAASQKRSWTSCGCALSAGEVQGGKRHQPASTPALSFGNRSRSGERLATSTSSQGSMRGTAHTAMLIAPCNGSTSAGMSSLEVLKAGGIGGTSSAATMADSGMSRTVIGTPGSSTFENCRAMPSRRARSSAFSTTSSEIAKTGSEPGQYTATSEGTVASSGECVHCEPRRTDTSNAGSFFASSLMRTGIRCSDRAASGSSA